MTMTTIVSSTYTEGDVQADGRRYVQETHLLDDGRTVDFEYLADDTIDPATVMAARAARLNAEIAAKDSALLIASNGALPLTKLQFRRLFSGAEQKAIDRFNVQFESRADLTDDQKDEIRSGLENFKAAQDVNLSDPATALAVQTYEALGLINAGRAAVILNG